ncbi:MAG: cytochrome c family protein [Acidobacteriia bacterium]|nr:cytochrome c family protein [Terriglobia bacterium]
MLRSGSRDVRLLRAALQLAAATICLLPAALAPTGGQTTARAAQTGPFRNAVAGTRYVGSKVCGACHPQIYASYNKTGMGRSIVAGEDKSLLERLPAPFNLFDSDTGQFFEVFRKEGMLYQSQYAVDRDGKEVFRQTWALAFAVGAGENGFGFIVQRDGHLFEAPLTYYTQSRTWGLSPGYELRNYGFTRPILAQCIGCHSGRPQPVPAFAGVYRDPPFAEMAVGCENCHGPGELHVSERQTGRRPAGAFDSSIVNPSRLPGWLADNICMKCHQGGDVRVLQPGKQEQDFRPGTRLDTVESIFKVPLNSDSPLQSVLVEHYFGMRLSKCYRASAGKLSCMTCHNPHAELSGLEAVEYYRAKCLSCHRPEGCKLPVAERVKKSSANDCPSCHMPKRTVTTITHAALTDHSIAARPGELYPEEAFSSHAAGATGLLHLTSAPGESPSSIPQVTLLRAYLDLIRDGHKEFTSRKNELLDKLALSAPGDPMVLAALGRRAASDHTREGLRAGIRHLAGAVRAGSTAPEDFLLLGELYGRDDRHVDAIRVLEKGREANPYFVEFYEAVAVQQMALGKYGDALQVIRKGLSLFPGDNTLRLLEKKVGSATLDDTTSK